MQGAHIYPHFYSIYSIRSLVLRISSQSQPCIKSVQHCCSTKIQMLICKAQTKLCVIMFHTELHSVFRKQFYNYIFLNNVHHAESAKDIKYQTDKSGGASSALSNLNSNKKIHYFYLEISISAIIQYIEIWHKKYAYLSTFHVFIVLTFILWSACRMFAYQIIGPNGQ